jgi:hypothetical protein
MHDEVGRTRAGFRAWAQTWPGLLTLGFFALLLLLILGYVEENWRGDRVWADTKAELEARGESFDRKKFIPPPVPDDQNFGALDYFRPTRDDKMHLSDLLAPVYTKMPVSKDEVKENPDWLPYLGRWRNGETTDDGATEKKLEDFLHHLDPHAQIPPGATPSEVFNRICPTLADLRTANARHPLCRFDLDYANPKPWMIPLGPVTYPIQLAKILSYDSQLALLSHHPEIALEDSQIDWKVYAGLRREPILVAGLVSLGVIAIQLNVIEQGLLEHDWTDAQLAQIDDDLGKLDALSDAQLSLRGDVAMFLIPISDIVLVNRSLLFDMYPGGGSSFDYKSLESWQELGVRMFYTSVPNGWIQINRADTARRILDGVRAVDPAAHRIYPERVDTAVPAHSGSESLEFLTAAAGPMLSSIKKFAFQQTQIDMARIACRLERYRLAHGSYPASLDALVPAYGAELPPDIMSGQPYIYRLNKDGTYLLYSVGWNQKDDHGDISSSSYPSSSYPTSESLDWVWQNTPNKKK